MALPSMRAGITGREFLRIAGGFGSAALGSSPAGGLDIDNAGNLATDGDVTANAVAIGTSTPTEKLQVVSSANEAVVAEVKSSNSGASAVGILKATADGGSLQCQMHGTGRTGTRYGITLGDYGEILASNASGLLIGSDAGGKIVFGTNSAERMRINSVGDVAIGTVLTSARLRVDQDSATGAKPVLYLDQADVSEEMIRFNTTIGVGNAIEAVGAKTLTTTHFIKVTIPGGLARYIPVGTIA